MHCINKMIGAMNQRKQEKADEEIELSTLSLARVLYHELHPQGAVQVL